MTAPDGSAPVAAGPTHSADYDDADPSVAAEIMGSRLQLFEAPQELLTKDDYYTPKHVFDALGLRFDIDVCAPPGGVPWVPCSRYFTMAEDGLAQPWEGKVWMNPPYSQTTPWIKRFMEHRNGVTLVQHAKSAWHPKLWADAEAVAFLFAYFDFVGGSVSCPVWFAAYGQECAEALARVGVVRRKDAA